MFFAPKKKHVAHQPQKETKPIERRFLPRWHINMVAKVKWEGEEQYRDVMVHDINLKGVSLQTPFAFPSNISSISLYFNEHCFFTVQILVENHEHKGQEHHYNMRFTRIYDADREKLCRMIRQNFPDQLKLC